MTTTLRLVAASLAVVFVSSAAMASTLVVRGRLTNAHGEPESGSCLLRFKLFDVTPGAAEVWSDSLYIRLGSGQFDISLGKTQPIPPRLLTDGYRLAIEAPAGTGWKAVATSVTEDGKARAAQADAPEHPKVREIRRLKENLSKTDPKPAAEPAEPAVAPPAAAQAPPANPEETARLKARLEALEKKLQPGPREFRARIYEVQPGDTLKSVAYKLWGDPSRWAALYHSNADRIQRGGDLRPGQKLVVPDVGR